MGRVERYPAGTFCSIELLTPRLADDAAFYRDLLGWEVTIDVDTAVARLDGLTVARLVSEPAGGGWQSGIAVDDPAAIAHRASELGGLAIDARMIRDPEGAGVWLRTIGQDPGAELVNEIGAWCWTELTAMDLGRVTRFYRDLLGWTTGAVEAEVERGSFKLGDLLVGGFHAAQAGDSGGSFWQVGFRVASARDSAERASELGGSVLLEPMDIPIGAFAVVADPAGAPFTLTDFAAPFEGVDELRR